MSEELENRNSDTEMTEEASFRRNADADTPENVGDNGNKTVKVEIKSDIEMPDRTSDCETDLFHEIPLETLAISETPEGASVSGNNDNDDIGLSPNGGILDDTVAVPSEREEVHFDDDFQEEPDVVGESAEVQFDEDDEEFVDASSEMPEVQIDTNSILVADITAANLEDLLPDVPDFQIEMAEIDTDSDISTPGQRSIRRTAAAETRVIGNRAMDPPQETIENSDENVQDEQIIIQSEIPDGNGVSGGQGTQENFGDIITSALGGIPETFSRDSSSRGSSNESMAVVIEEIRYDREMNDENERGEKCRNLCYRTWELLAQSGVRIYVFSQENIRQLALTSPMSITRAWTISAYATCTVPSYIGYDNKKQSYELKSWTPQIVLCYLQHILVTADAISNLHLVAKILNGTLSPYTFIQLGAVMGSFVTTLLFSKVCLFDVNKLRSYENEIEDKDENAAEPEQNPSDNMNEKRQQKGALKTALSYGIISQIFLWFLIATDGIINLKNFDNNWRESGSAAVLQSFACHTRKVYLWRNTTTCSLDWLADEVAELPTEEIVLGIVGITSFLNTKIAKYQRHVLINTINMAFFMDTWEADTAIRESDKPLIAIYDHLKGQTDKLSAFGGPLLLVQLAEIAFRLPGWSLLILKGDMLTKMQLLTLLLVFFLFVVLGCMGTWMSHMIRGEMSRPRGYSSLPATAKETAVFFVQLYHNSVGLGIPGLVVLSFATMTGYMSTVGGYVMMLYEIEHNDCAMMKN